ncbi:MAG: hypothetical protein P8P80_08910 [Crocinitomicaceae bacterium]|nr:hypothetical protein [Crocinitomicaceae bacterium]MDG1735563.1 hypothetical protein [Crocinitomicaceae bacterium]
MPQFQIYFFRLLLFVFLQSFIFNQLEINAVIHIMITPLYIFLLPFERSVISLLLAALVLGLTVDATSNTFGLHTSSLLLFAYLRPVIFRVFSPRDGYDSLKTPSIFDMGNRWFISTFSILLLCHHLWFFTLEDFSLSETLIILQKTLLSSVISFVVCVILQTIFIKRTS